MQPQTEARTCRDCGGRYCRSGVPADLDPGTCPDCTIHTNPTLHPTNGQSQPGEITQVQPTAQHTPGPWHVRADGGIDSPSKCIAHMSNITARQWPGQSDANARLIAAAPDLLAALQGLVVQIGQRVVMTPEETKTYEAARAAIAKARK